MTPEDESRIAQYLRAPDTLSDEQVRAVEALLADDLSAAAYAQALQALDDHIDPTAPRSDRIDAFVDTLFDEEPSTSPLRRRMEPFQTSRSSSTVMAAATATNAPDQRFPVLATLASDDQRVLLRVVADRETQQGHLYVLAEVGTHPGAVMVSFPAFDLHLATNENGRCTFDLPSDIDADAWIEASALLRRSVATGEVAPGGDETLSGPSGAPVHCTRTADTLSVRGPDGDDPAASMLLIEQDDGPQRLVSLPPDAPIALDAFSDRPLRLRLYA